MNKPRSKFKPSDLVRVIAPELSGGWPLTEEFKEHQREKWETAIGAICVVKEVEYNENPLFEATQFSYYVEAVRGEIPYEAWIDEACFELVRRHLELEE